MIEIRPYDFARDDSQLTDIQRMWRRGMREIPREALRRYGKSIFSFAVKFVFPSVMICSGIMASTVSAMLFICTLAILMSAVLPSTAIYLYYSYLNKRYIEMSLKDDWWRLEQVYSKPGGLWVAVDTALTDQYPSSGGKIVGMVGLDAHMRYENTHKNSPDKTAKEGNDTGETHASACLRMELRRMTVHPDYRCRGIARQLIDTLIRHALQYHASEIYLTMVHLQPVAERMYQRHGFRYLRRFRAHPFLYVHENILTLE